VRLGQNCLSSIIQPHIHLTLSMDTIQHGGFDCIWYSRCANPHHLFASAFQTCQDAFYCSWKCEYPIQLREQKEYEHTAAALYSAKVPKQTCPCKRRNAVKSIYALSTVLKGIITASLVSSCHQMHQTEEVLTASCSNSLHSSRPTLLRSLPPRLDSDVTSFSPADCS
jgi:hypothetical protein